MKSKKDGDKGRLISDTQIAYDFAVKCYKKFRDVIKAIALFGSVPKMEAKEKSDIDLIIIIDDCTINWDDELISWYREELAKLLAAQKYKKEIHINTVTLTAFWDEIRRGEPLIINVLRYGEPLIDLGGFFDPLKILLAKGKIRPTAEAIFTTMERTGAHLGRANLSILSSVEGFYWAMVDASQATLMAYHIIPPSPENIPELLKLNFVERKMINKDMLDWFMDVRKKAKEVLQGEIKKINGKDLEDIQRKSEAYVYRMNELTKSLIKNEKIIKIENKVI